MADSALPVELEPRGNAGRRDLLSLVDGTGFELDLTEQDSGAADDIRFAVPAITDDDIDAVTKVLRSGWITTGAECLALEDELAEYLGVEHVIAMSSCTAALETAAAALAMKPGARVGVPVWTFVSTALAFASHGAIPVLIDIDPTTLNLSPQAVKDAVEEGLDALVVVHFGGVPVDPEIYAICADAGVPVVEDAAHALGASDDRGLIAGRGTIGACFSFYATKNLTCAEGGALVTEDPEIAAFARSFRSHGMSRDAWTRYAPGGNALYNLVMPGIKGNLPDLLATLARSQLRRFPEMQQRRRMLVDHYRERLEDLDGVSCVPTEQHLGSADHLMVVKLPRYVDRQCVIHRMATKGIGTSVHFQRLSEFAWFQDNAHVGPGGTPAADSLARQVLSLPLHSLLRRRDVDRVVDELGHALG